MKTSLPSEWEIVLDEEHETHFPSIIVHHVKIQNKYSNKEYSFVCAVQDFSYDRAILYLLKCIKEDL